MLSRLPPVTRALLIANLAAYLLQLIAGNVVFRWCALWPVLPGGLSAAGTPSFFPWQLITYAFLHGNLGHIFFNMLGLVMFGAPLEHHFGSRRFATFFFVAVLGAAACQLSLSTWTAWRDSAVYPTVGASGGVYGLLLAYGLLFPSDLVMPFPGLMMRARTVVIVFGVLELLFGVLGVDRGVAHLAHLGGMLAGGVLLWIWRRPGAGSVEPPRRKRPKYIRIVK